MGNPYDDLYEFRAAITEPPSVRDGLLFAYAEAASDGSWKPADRGVMGGLADETGRFRGVSVFCGVTVGLSLARVREASSLATCCVDWSSVKRRNRVLSRWSERRRESRGGDVTW